MGLEPEYVLEDWKEDQSRKDKYWRGGSKAMDKGTGPLEEKHWWSEKRHSGRDHKKKHYRITRKRLKTEEMGLL